MVSKRPVIRFNGGGVAQLVEHQSFNRKVEGSIPELGVTSLCPWERHFMPISQTGPSCLPVVVAQSD